MSVPGASATGGNRLSHGQSWFTATHQALAIPELLERILLYVFAIPLRPAIEPWMRFDCGPSDIGVKSFFSLRRPLIIPSNNHDGYDSAIVPCHVAYQPARLVCRRWNMLYEQMSCLRFTAWMMKPSGWLYKEAAAATLKTLRKGPISDLQNCQRLNLFILSEPNGIDRYDAAMIASRRLQWENLLEAMRDNRSCKSQSHSCWGLDGEHRSESGGGDNDDDEAETMFSIPIPVAAWPTRPRLSDWRRWTGASIRELCFRATGAVDTYLHRILRLSHVNHSVTLLDIRFSHDIQFNLHVLLVDFKNIGNGDHDSGNHNNRHHQEAGDPMLLPNLQHLIVHGAILREPSTLLSSSQLADQPQTTITETSPRLYDNSYDPLDSTTPFDAFFLPRKLRPLRQRLQSLDHGDDDDGGGEDPMLIKRKLRTFRLSNCDISKAYLFTLLRHLDRQHLRSLALNNLYKRYRQSQLQITRSMVRLAFFGCSAYPMNKVDFTRILQTTQLESQSMQSRPRIQLRGWDRRTNSHVVPENPLATVVAAALATGDQDGTGGPGGGRIEQSSEMQQVLNRFQKMNADTQHLTRRFPHLQDISLHASSDRDIHPLDALLLLRAHLFPEPDLLSIPGGDDKDRHFNDQNESVSIDCFDFSHNTFLRSLLINRSLTRLEITGTSVASLHGDPAMERLVAFLCSDQARDLVEFIAPKVHYPVEFVAPPPMDDDTDEDEDDDTEEEDEEALSMAGMGIEELESETIDGPLLRQQSSSTSNALKARVSNYVQRLVHYRSSTTSACVNGRPKWITFKKTKKNHEKMESQTRSELHTSPFSPAATTSCSNLPSRVWACGSTLKRLELSFTSRSHDGWTLASSTRAVFGFLVTTLPNLRQLVVRQEFGVLAIDGGLCLLTRLRHLQRLEIQVRQFRHWAASYDSTLLMGANLTASTTIQSSPSSSSAPLSPKESLDHKKKNHRCGDGDLASIIKHRLLTWLQSDPGDIVTTTTIRKTKDIVSEKQAGQEQQQQSQPHTNKQQHPPGTSSLAIARRVALLDHGGGHFAKGAGRAMLWGKPSSSSVAATATTPSSSSSSSPSPRATTPQTRGCCWLQMQRIIIKYEHDQPQDVQAFQEAFYSVRPDIDLYCKTVCWCS
ncbi:hypothetical protein DFQ26_001218 [Actinomortierella ambigua]|nr:hypothetical protein DFQ26_001218 [Actinomortierella ambigua]